MQQKNLWIEHRDAFALASVASIAISVIFLVVRLAGGIAYWAAGCINLLFAVMAFVFAVFAWGCDYLSTRKPMIRTSSTRYQRLKRKTVRSLRKLKAEGKLTQNEIQKKKGAFLVIARKCGVDQEQARDDFELEIRRRVG